MHGVRDTMVGNSTCIKNFSKTCLSPTLCAKQELLELVIKLLSSKLLKEKFPCNKSVRMDFDIIQESRTSNRGKYQTGEFMKLNR